MPVRYRFGMATVPLHRASQRALDGKRSLDIVVAAAVLAALVVPLVLLALAIRLDGGPAIYRHRRLGRDGEFDCLKLRTMRVDADAALAAHLAACPVAAAEWEANRKLANDPRITPLGRFLRRTSIDELPQLWNVLRGEMSLVGPRPMVREEAVRYGAAISAYLSVRPGLTGLWQITARGGEFTQRVALDREYAAARTLALDLAILVRTVPAVLHGRGAC